MGISKSHAHPRQPLHLRRVQLHVIGVAGKILKGTGIAHTHNSQGGSCAGVGIKGGGIGGVLEGAGGTSVQEFSDECHAGPVAFHSGADGGECATARQLHH